MKKILLIAMAVLGVAFASNAQNANRSGVFIELAPGITINSYKLEKCFSTSFDAGYRWAFHRHWALDARLKFELFRFLSDDTGMPVGITVLPALRYTSSELGYDSNISFYASMGVGYYYLGLFGYDVQLGFNLSNHFYLGLKHDGHMDFDFYAPIGVCLGYRF